MATPKGALVLSGKGGVGKTVIAINIAQHLQDKEVKVGLLDADFSASNSGYFLNLENREIIIDREQFRPITVNGLEVFSIPLWLGEKAVSMTGDQYSQILRDAVQEGIWKAEYIIVDCPAGFGDELKTAAKVFSESLLGSVIVMQPAHELDARRALQLHKDLELPVLGLIENMTYFKSGVVKYKIFGESVVDQLGEEFGVPVFGKIPLSTKIREQVEKKNPKFTGEFAEPILKAVDSIVKAKPQKPGFLAKIKLFLKEQTEKLLLTMLININKELNIPEIQERFGYPGGSIIRLNIMDEKMDKAIYTADWRISHGQLVLLDGDYNWDAQIDITINAVKWSILRNKTTSSGYPYTFQDALRLGHMRIYGERSMVRGAHFMSNVFTELSHNQNAMTKIRPILEVL